MIERLKEKYKNEVVKKMMERFGYKNPLEVPKIEKVVLNVGFGKQVAGKSTEEINKIVNYVIEDLTMIAGQRAVKTLARKSISAFKIRKGLPIGAKVTLRKQRMWDFLERLIHIVLPRTRDFKGISEKAVDKQGNLTIGIEEHIAFPEIAPEKTKFNFGLQITIVNTAKSREEGLELFKMLNFPIREEKN